MTASNWIKKNIRGGFTLLIFFTIVEPLFAKDLVLGAYQITYELAQSSFTTTLIVDQKLPGRKGSYRGFEYDTKQRFVATVTGSQMCTVPPSTGIQSFSYCFSWPAKKTSTAQTLVVTCLDDFSMTSTYKCVGDAYPARVKRVELNGLPNP